MYRKFMSQFVVATSIGLSGFYLGRNVENQRNVESNFILDDRGKRV